MFSQMLLRTIQQNLATSLTLSTRKAQITEGSRARLLEILLSASNLRLHTILQQQNGSRRVRHTTLRGCQIL